MLHRGFLGAVIFICIGIAAGCWPVPTLPGRAAATNSATIVRLVNSYTEAGSDAIYKSHGTAFFVQYKERLLLITAYHVVDRAGTITIESTDGVVYIKLGKRSVNKLQDLAVYEVIDVYPHVTPFKLAGKLQVGDVLTMLGFPGGEPGISVIHGEVVQHTALVSTTKVKAGMSGGPVVNTAGEVVGIIHGSSIMHTGDSSVTHGVCNVTGSLLWSEE